MKPQGFLRPLLFLCCSVIFYTTTSSQSISGIVNSYYKVTGVNVIPNTVTVSSSAGLTPGQKILIIQMKGATINSANSNLFGNVTALGNAGNYEFNFVCGIAGNNVLLQYELLRPYDAAGLVQLIPVPQYNSVTVVDTVRPATWNAATGTGGVVVIEAANTIFLNSAIDASAKGFTGGSLQNYPDCLWATDVAAFSLPISSADVNVNAARKGEGIAAFIVNNEFAKGKQANGGGGGNNHNTGGAGGANFGAGGNGGIRSNETFFQCHGTSAGVGGLSVASYGYSTGVNNRIFLGGGGGAGHQNNSVGTPGGNGGGIIILLANTIHNGGGRLMSNGGAPYNPACVNPLQAEGDGGGGGGSGGTIILNVQNIANGTLTSEARGAAGSIAGVATNNCTGPGGGGGGGILWVSNAATLPSISSTVTGGANGIISMVNSTVACRGLANGASSGGIGTTQTGYTPPIASNFVCAPLASDNLLRFDGKSIETGNLLSWTVSSFDEIAYYQVERSDNQVFFESKLFVKNNSMKAMSVEDKNVPPGTSFYRLKLVYKNGDSEYSKVIAINSKPGNGIVWMGLYPNPASDHVGLTISSPEQGSLQINIYNQQGQQIRNSKQYIKTGYSTINLSIQNLPAGVYFIGLEMNGHRQMRKVIVNSSLR